MSTRPDSITAKIELRLVVPGSPSLPVMADARRAYEAGMAQGREWLRQGDNGLIVATVAIALLLLLVVAAL